MTTSDSYLLNSVSDLINSDHVNEIIRLQESMLQKFEKTNEMLRTVCELSVQRHRVLSSEFVAHTQKIQKLKKELENIFKRIQALKCLFTMSYPREMEQFSQHLTQPDSDEERPTAGSLTAPHGLSLLFQAYRMMKLVMQVLHGLSQELENTRSFLSYVVREAAHLTIVEPRAKRIVATGTLVCLCLFLLLLTCNLSNSLALTAFTHLLIFDLLSLTVALTSVWASKKSPSLDGYTLGYERFEVVAVFSATILAILSSFFEIKEAVERIFEPAEVNTGLLVVMCPVAFLVHVLTIYGIDNPAFDHVILASGSSWLQVSCTSVELVIEFFASILGSTQKRL
ncbi:hypothetical protein P879_09115 [Paragonimus westermani]|uniref:KxDL domain-containing protein n=1 Tax=Paragonimus westermani TaxID=34504 RepID=A0A8T0CYE3_9TREM|nr:hypothetical protein P879_09115 [Paragonimus westermani]